MRLCGIEKTSVWRTLLLVVGLMSATAGPLWAYPSSLVYEGSSIVWSVGEKRIWRFPDAFAAEVEEMSDRFNGIYALGFRLPDLKVEKRNERWSLCIGRDTIFAARPEHAGVIRLNTHLMSLMWMSRVYEALGALHAKELTPAYKLRGGYDVAGSISWYGSEKFFGRRFANGERFTESHLSAAAMNLPFGTLVRITTPATGKTVVVRVTDRFREHKNRVLDISRAAAEILGIRRMGIAKAQVQVIGRVEEIGGK